MIETFSSGYLRKMNSTKSEKECVPLSSGGVVLNHRLFILLMSIWRFPNPRFPWLTSLFSLDIRREKAILQGPVCTLEHRNIQSIFDFKVHSRHSVRLY